MGSDTLVASLQSQSVPSRLAALLRPRALALAATLGGLACSPDDPPALPEGVCEAVVWGTPQRPSERLSIIGSWNNWTTPTPMADFTEPPWQVARLALLPATYQYLVIEEDQARPDRHNPLTAFRTDGLEVSHLVVPDCTRPQLSVAEVVADTPDSFAVDVTLTPAQDGTPIDRQTIAATLDDGTALSLESYDATTQVARLRGTGLPRGKHRVQITATDERDREADAVVAAGWIQPVADTWDDGIVYQIMIDRYRAEGGVELPPPPDAGARAGGTLTGVLDELRAGTFANLGTSALWLSPVYLNPTEAREGRDDDRLYEGYHGYWPLDTRAVDPRIGGEATLHELIAEAHRQGIRVLLDLVPNHLYEDNPRVAAHRAEGWFHEHEPECICGAPSCPWHEFIQVCWFTPYLPDLRLQHPAALQSVVDDALWWQDTFDIDGFRIDAVPMMPRAASRRIVHSMRDAVGPRSAAFSIGEIFTGPGAGGTEIIRYHLGPDGLDSAFDFPLMWSIRSVLAHDSADWSAIEATLADTEAALDGSGAVIGRMIGNHDVTRFASEAAGDAGGDPWESPPPASADPDVYRRTGLALGLVLTLPGLPVLYYGDEVGLAGAGDPDNRRVMPSDDALATAQQELRAQTQALAAVRRCSAALRRGDRRPLVADAEHYAFARTLGEESVIVVLSRSTEATTLRVPAGATPAPGWYKDALTGQRFELSNAAIELEPLSMRVLVPEASPCG